MVIERVVLHRLVGAHRAVSWLVRLGVVPPGAAVVHVPAHVDTQRYDILLVYAGRLGAGLEAAGVFDCFLVDAEIDAQDDEARDVKRASHGEEDVAWLGGHGAHPWVWVGRLLEREVAVVDIKTCLIF